MKLLKSLAASSDQIDTVTMDVPMLIRVMELSREDIKTDAELHVVATKIIELSKTKEVLTIEDYPTIYGKEVQSAAKGSEYDKVVKRLETTIPMLEKLITEEKDENARHYLKGSCLYSVRSLISQFKNWRTLVVK